jgi:hypothetical protein
MIETGRLTVRNRTSAGAALLTIQEGAVVRPLRFTVPMIEADQARDIEEKLAALLEVRVDDLRDYLAGNVRAGGSRRTGYRFVRGTHGGRYIGDPEGTDIVPRGYQIPA